MRRRATAGVRYDAANSVDDADQWSDVDQWDTVDVSIAHERGILGASDYRSGTFRGSSAENARSRV